MRLHEQLTDGLGRPLDPERREAAMVVLAKAGYIFHDPVLMLQQFRAVQKDAVYAMTRELARADYPQGGTELTGGTYV